MTMGHVDPNQNRSVLRRITTGMTVYDVNGDKVGTVEDLYFGADADDPQGYGTGAATTGMPRTTATNGLVEDVIRGLFADDNMPETLRNRLLNEGFIQIEPGTLFGADMFATPDQIAGASSDGVRLNVEAQSLVRG